MPDDHTPEEDQPASPWSVRPSRSPDESNLTSRGAEALNRGRSIFNRFRRDRGTEVVQARLPFGDDDADETDDGDDVLAASGAPPLEPARSPWRRPSEAAPPSSGLSTPPALPTPSAAPPSRATPLGEADPAREDAREEPVVADAPRVAAPAPVAPPARATFEPPPVTAASPETEVADTATPQTPIEEPSIVATEATEATAAGWTPPLAPARPALEAQPSEREPYGEPALTWASLRPIPVPINPYMVLLAIVVTLVTLAYLLVEPSPRWFLILGAVAVAGGLDGTLRTTWRVTYRHDDTTPALFMPAILVLAVPPLIEHNVRGLGVVAAGLAFGVTFFAVAAAQVGSARPGASYFAWSRTVSIAGTYAAAFAFFSLTYIYDLGLGVSAVATGLVALMLAIEVLREGEIDAAETAGYAAAAGAAVGQWRLALHYLPVDGYLAGLAVVLGFLVVTGLLHAYVTRSLDRRATIDHALVAVGGAALVIGARAAGLA